MLLDGSGLRFLGFIRYSCCLFAYRGVHLFSEFVEGTL